MVRIHPDSGRRLLNVNPQFTVRINGLKEDESSMILQYLYSRAQVPEYQLRIRWQPHTIVIWDNRALIASISERAGAGRAPRVRYR